MPHLQDGVDSIFGEILTATPEPKNNHDRHAACVKKDGEIVGHVPCELSQMVWHFLTT